MIAKKLNGNRKEITTDCDAISILLSATNLDNIKKKEIKSFLSLFGTDLTFRCGLPQNVVGSSRKDGVFSCAGKSGGNKCQHLPNNLQGNQILIIDSPIKLACHKSCKEKIINCLSKKGFILSPSSQEGLCFDSRKASNKPLYFALVDAIVDSCFAEETGMHMIHIADMGMRLPITVNERGCPLNKIFTGIEKLRKTQVTVDITQIDIGFNAQAGKNQLILFSCLKEKNTTESILTKTTHKVFPLHKLSKEESEGAIISQEQKGSVLLSKKKWEIPTIIDLKQIVSDQISRGDEPNNGMENVLSKYSSESGDTTMNTFSNSVYSIKIYSTIAHYLMQQRSKFPLQQSEMYNIGNCSMIQLQRLMKYIDDVSKGSFQHINDHGIQARIEVSVRPFHQDKNLRELGHYNDFITLAYLAISDVMQESYYTIRYETIHPQPVQVMSQTLIGQIMPYFMLRASSQFNKSYSNSRTTDWLKAHLSMILISIGFGPAYTVKFINSWLKDSDRYDPHELVKIVHRNSLRILPQDKQLLTEKAKTAISNILKSYFSINGQTVLSRYIKYTSSSSSHSQNIRLWYNQLSHKDKISMASQLLLQIIPQLTLLLSKETTKENTDKKHDAELRTTNEYEEILGSDPWSEGVHFINTVTYNCNEDYDSSPLSRSQGIFLPKDPISRIVIFILQFGIFSDHRRPMFLRKLSKFVLLCHSGRIILPGHSCPLEPLDHTNNKGFDLLTRCANDGNYHMSNNECANDENYHMSNNELQIICRELHVPVSGTNQKNETYIKSLCLFYFFPCSGVIFSREGTRKTYSHEVINELINKVNGWDIVKNMPCNSIHKVRLYRNSENTGITITQKESLVIVNRTLSGAHDHGNTSLNGFQVLCTCLNVDITHTSKLRKTLQKKLSNLNFLSEHFLTENGHVNTNFIGVSSLAELDRKHGMLLLPSSSSLINVKKSVVFKPDVILPLASLVYNINIMYYNTEEDVSELHVFHQEKCITYKFTSTLVIPKIACGAILSCHLVEGVVLYSICPSNLTPSQTTPYMSATPSPPVCHRLFRGRLSKSTNSSNLQLPKPITRAKQSLIKTLGLLLLKIHGTPIQQLLLLDEYCDDLSLDETKGQLKFFDSTTIDNDKKLLMPMRTLAVYLRSVNPDYLTHHTLCPLLCLKYKLSFAVFEICRSKGRTYFYAYDISSKKVVMSVQDSYCVLIDRSSIIYIHSSSSKTGYHPPSGTYHQHQSINQSYSNIDNITMTQATNVFKNTLETKVYIGTDSVRDYSVLCSCKTTSMIITHLTSPRRINASLLDLSFQGLSMYTLILVFPTFIGNTQQWDTCLVHHSVQKGEAEQHLSSILRSMCEGYINPSTELNKFKTNYISAVSTSEGEYGFYILLYMFIGHHCKTFSDFSNASHKLASETDLKRKTKDWMKKNIFGNNGFSTPTWLKQITDE